MKKSGKKAVITAVILALLLAAGAGVWYFFLRGESNSANAVYVESVASLTGGYSESTRYSGIVEAQDTLTIKNDSSKKIDTIFVKEGQSVVIGTPLFSYDVTEAQNNILSSNLEIEGIDNEIAALNAEITELDQQRSSAPESEKLEYTTEIQKRQMSIRQNQYDRETKVAAIAGYQKEIDTATVLSSIAGTVKTINDTDDSDMGASDPVFMVITQTGEFRVKGTLDEMSVMAISTGTDVIIRSRVDEEKTWKGTVTKIDLEPQTEEENDYYMDSQGDKASKYPFYVQLESMDGLILGQHVFIEMDYGQSDRSGIWLNQEYIFYDEEGNPFIWAADSRGRIEKREVVLGESDDETYTTEIVSGISTSDRIAWPEESIREGMPVTETMPEYEEPEGGMDYPEGEMEYPEGEMEYPEGGMDFPEGEMDHPAEGPEGEYPGAEEEFPEAETETEGD
ncbi:MAG: efflux RND transporter periplasmic adaptor subunit [Solobacterium sp.]|nr:efflux RND transporter periplasmic adaptor subunit [Solobacterium sp.]